MQYKFNLSKIDKPIDIKIINKIIASVISKASEARGRNLVHLTFLSYFLSIISFTIQPADLIIKEPYANNKIR